MNSFSDSRPKHIGEIVDDGQKQYFTVRRQKTSFIFAGQMQGNSLFDSQRYKSFIRICLIWNSTVELFYSWVQWTK